MVDAGLDVREWRILERDAVAFGLTYPGTPWARSSCFIVVWSILCPLYVTYLFPCVCVYVFMFVFVCVFHVQTVPVEDRIGLQILWKWR